jgi:holo-[acyl-carrier protein] synthase
MIFGTGIDILDIDRMRKQMSESNERFFEMLFTENEKQYCRQGTHLNVQAQRFAGRFAAKEAFLKALGTGLRDGIRWLDIEIRNDELGKPFFHLSNEALNKSKDAGIQRLHVSITHSRTYAAAMVILET